MTSTAAILGLGMSFHRCRASCRNMPSHQQYQSPSWRIKNPPLTRVTILFSNSPQLAIQSRGFSNPQANPHLYPPPLLARPPAIRLSPLSLPIPLCRRAKLSPPTIGQFGCQTPSPPLFLFLLPLSTKTLSKISILWEENRSDSESLSHHFRLGCLESPDAGL